MTPAEYKDALRRLDMTQEAFGRWLGVSLRTAQYYAAKGPSAPAAKAIQLLLEQRGIRT